MAKVIKARKGTKYETPEDAELYGKDAARIAADREAEDKPEQFSFDGFGINDSGPYAARIATLTNHGRGINAGPLLAAAPDLLAIVQELERYMLARNLAAMGDLAAGVNIDFFAVRAAVTKAVAK